VLFKQAARHYQQICQPTLTTVALISLFPAAAGESKSMILTKFAVAILFITAMTPRKHIDLAAVRPPDLPIRSSYVKGCVRAFDDQTPKPPDLCYPFPAQVRIVAYKQGGGYSKASLTVDVTNSSSAAIALPVAASPSPTANELTQVSFRITLGNQAESIGDGFAYSDTEEPTSIAMVEPGESIEYYIPVDLERFKKMLQPSETTVPVVVKLNASKLKKQSNGEWVSITDADPIPSKIFRIPYPN
jgi:hypothetical protein